MCVCVCVFSISKDISVRCSNRPASVYETGGSGSEELKKPSFFPCNSVIREWSLEITK